MIWNFPVLWQNVAHFFYKTEVKDKFRSNTKIIGGIFLKKKTIAIITIIPLATVILNLYQYFFIVDGVEFVRLFYRYKNEEFIIVKYEDINKKVAEVSLNAEQTEALIALFIETKFHIIYAGSIFITEPNPTHYEIRVNSSTSELFCAHSLGGEYLSVPNMYSGKHLQIENEQWNEKLENILALTPMNRKNPTRRANFKAVFPVQPDLQIPMVILQ